MQHVPHAQGVTDAVAKRNVIGASQYSINGKSFWWYAHTSISFDNGWSFPGIFTGNELRRRGVPDPVPHEQGLLRPKPNEWFVPALYSD